MSAEKYSPCDDCKVAACHRRASTDVNVELLEALKETVTALCEYCPADMTKKEKKACSLCNKIVRYKQLIRATENTERH